MLVLDDFSLSIVRQRESVKGAREVLVFSHVECPVFHYQNLLKMTISGPNKVINIASRQSSRKSIGHQRIQSSV